MKILNLNRSVILNEMTKYIFILFAISIIGCTHHENQKRLNNKEKEALRIDTKILKSLDDSLNSTGDFRYYEKYILKIDEMIKKYPEQKELLRVRESMKEIYKNSLIPSKVVK